MPFKEAQFLSLTSFFQLCSALSLLPVKVKYPLPLDPSNVKGKFQFRPPETVKVVGSYLLGTVTKPDLNIDLVLQIPQVVCVCGGGVWCGYGGVWVWLWVGVGVDNAIRYSNCEHCVKS